MLLLLVVVVMLVVMLLLLLQLRGLLLPHRRRRLPAMTSRRCAAGSLNAPVLAMILPPMMAIRVLDP